MNPTLALAEQLIACHSETPEDAGCQAIIGQRLQALGFELEPVHSGPAHFRVANLWAIRRPLASAPLGTATPLLVFAGHTDVVPTGPLEQWTSPPFVPTQRDNKLYGRGAADMKTSLAAFVVATEEFLAHNAHTSLAIGFLLTSDEEGPALDGTIKVVELLRERGEIHRDLTVLQ
jgi:succinyl-diaminopimelate desuccinylase